MKKIAGFAIFCAIMIFSISVYAHEATTVKNSNGSYTTSGIITDGGSSYVTIVVHCGSSIDVDSVQYLDQQQADASGRFSFTYKLKEEPSAGGMDYYVKIGGIKLASPIAAGVIEAPVGPSYVSGTISCMGDKTGAVVKAIAANQGVTKGTVREDGTFKIESLYPGDYTITATKAGHVMASTSVSITKNQNITGISFDLKPGDVNGDGNINIEDISLTISDYGLLEKADAFNENRDINDNGIVDLTDVTTIIINFE